MFTQETTRRMEGSPHDLTVGHLRRLFDGLPDEAEINFKVYKSDRPGERDSVTIEVTMKENPE